MNIKKIFKKKEKKRKNPTIARFENIESEVEKLKIQLEVVNETRKSKNEMMNSIEEQMGEIRGVLSDKEKELRELKMSVSKSVEMVNAAKPEKLMMETEKQNIKIETLKGKVDVQSSLTGKIMSEVKDLRKDMEVFRGVKQVIKMTNEAKSDIETVKQIKAVIEREADKSEKIMIKVQEMHNEFVNYKKSADSMQDQFRQVLKEFDDLRISLGKPSEKEGVLKKFMKLKF